MRRSILLGSRVAAGALCVASSAVIAAPVYADPSASDRDGVYTHTLERFGLHLSHDDGFAQGVAVCLVSDEPGQTLTDVATQVMAMHPMWKRIDAQHFVGAAGERYCPNKLPRGAHYPVCSPDETSAASFVTIPRQFRAHRTADRVGALSDAPYGVLR
jgi:hypothetical protein